MSSNTSSSRPRYVLYAKYDACPGSAACLELLENNAVIRKEVQVEDATLLTGVLPEWLDGTPTMVDRNTRTVAYGSAAIDDITALSNNSGNAFKAMSVGASTPLAAIAGDKVGEEPNATEEDLADASEEVKSISEKAIEEVVRTRLGEKRRSRSGAQAPSTPSPSEPSVFDGSVQRGGKA